MTPEEDRQLDAEADAYEAEATEYRRNQERLSRLRWVVVTIDGNREQAAFACDRLARAWMDAVGHTRLRLVCRDTWR